jgi:23S rRNA (pseudouridine1915-N3)-methyltransferase
MKIKLYCIGKIKEQYLKDGINEYVKRISPYSNVEIVEVADSKVKDNPNFADISKAKNEEGERVLKLLKNDYLIGLDMNKPEFTSEEFASFLNKKMVEGGSNISFVIGGSYGLSDALKARCNTSISLSKLTFLHQMTRLILLEQIYRGFKILNNETYHK